MKPPGTSYFTLRHAIALATVIAPFAAIGQAEACTVLGVASSSASNSVVDCDGATTNSAPGGQDGYGSVSDNGNTYTVHSTGSVVGARFGIQAGDNATLTIDGKVTGGEAVPPASAAGMLSP